LCVRLWRALQDKKQLDCYCEGHEWQEQCSEQGSPETCLQTR
jgi:hypothetical protein